MLRTLQSRILVIFAAGCILMFIGIQQPKAESESFRSIMAAFGAMGGETWSQKYAAGRFALGDSILSIAPPFRSLGGGTFFEGKPIVIAADSKQTTEKEGALSMLHGQWFLIHVNDTIGFAEERTCKGSGRDAANALQMNSKNGSGQIVDVLPCVMSLHPASKWLAAQLIADDSRYYSIMHLQNASGETILVYSDVSEWAKFIIGQLL
jgi:hypothetical protein